jgi:ABC-2 type transport system ATP-binding protein
MIVLNEVSKRFGKQWAVQSLDLEVPTGSIFGLLGHNGAGKSTLIGMILGQVFPSEGEISINGHDVFRERRQALARVGAIFETPSFYNYLSGLRNLKIFCEYSGVPESARLQQIIRFVNLEDCIHNNVGTYSHGMRQRLALAQALLPNPELLILDEPMSGLDPEGAVEMRNLILKLNREWGLTILLSSHVLHEVQRLCSHIAVLKQGIRIFSGQWRSADIETASVQIEVENPAGLESALIHAGLISGFTRPGHACLTTGHSIADVAGWLAVNGYRVRALTPIEYTLEDFYLQTVRSNPAESEPSCSVAESR